MVFWSRCKILACEVRACAESKILGFKSDTAVLTFTFHFLSSPLLSLFLPHFFSLAGHLVGILVGRVFRKTFRILGLGERKGRWVVEQDFHGNFQVNVTCFLPFSPVFMTELYSFWYGLKDLFLSLTIKTGDVTSGRRDMDLHRGLQVA